MVNFLTKQLLPFALASTFIFCSSNVKADYLYTYTSPLFSNVFNSGPESNNSPLTLNDFYKVEILSEVPIYAHINLDEVQVKFIAGDYEFTGLNVPPTDSNGHFNYITTVFGINSLDNNGLPDSWYFSYVETVPLSPLSYTQATIYSMTTNEIQLFDVSKYDYSMQLYSHTGIATSFGTWSVTEVSPTAVSEPNSYALLISGMGLITFLTRRR